MKKHTIDERQMGSLIEESQDLQVDAMRAEPAALDEIREIAGSRRNRAGQLVAPRSSPEELAAFADHRRSFLRSSGIGAGAFAAKGLFAGTIGAALASILSPQAASAQGNVDVAILNTASSLENLAVATYEAALGLPFIAQGNPTVKLFAETTMSQHAQHGGAFNKRAEELGGKTQGATNPVLTPMVDQAKAGLTGPAQVVELAAMLETVATQTYLANLSLFSSGSLRLLMASVMGVEAQHLATLRAVGALLAGGAPDLIAVPTDPAKLPAAAGSVAFPEPFENKGMARDPQEGLAR